MALLRASPRCCGASKDDASNPSKEEKTTNEHAGIAHHRGVFRDVYGLPQPGRLKHGSPWHRGNPDVKRVRTTDGQEVLRRPGSVREGSIEGEEGSAFHPGEASGDDSRTRRSRELHLHMALAERLAVE